MNAKSIYKQFYQKLIFATSLFIITLSFIFYGYTKATIYEEIKEQLLTDAKLIYKLSLNSQIKQDNFNIITNADISVDLISVEDLNQITYKRYKLNDDFYVELLFPFDLTSSKFIKITKNINSSRKMLNKIFNNILLLSLAGLIMVVLYAFAVSKTLLRPIILITEKLSNMNENFLTQIDKNALPIEFHPLANSINTLTNKIQTVLKFKKELFIGAAHELKTPLAVMKLKNEVTLRKKRDSKKYEEALKLGVSEIDTMNKMISSILDIGRAEGAQFEKPIAVDIIEFIQKKANDYRMLSAQKNIVIMLTSNVNRYTICLQPTLLTQILQNFVQNAIKFTPENKSIAINCEKRSDSIVVTVTDEGIGIDETIDLFAPFKRVGGKAGAGLGLFLAKNAADTLGGEISLKNRSDGKEGTVASVILYGEATCDVKK